MRCGFIQLGVSRNSGRGLTTVAAVVLAAGWLLGASLAAAQTPVPQLGARVERSAQLTRHADYAVAQMRSAGGTRIREYVSPAGTVFGIAWQGASAPNLRAMLGPKFAAYQRAAAGPRRRRGPLHIEVDGVVVDNAGHMRAFHGRAYLTDALPAGVSAAVVQ